MWFRAHKEELDPAISGIFDQQEKQVGGRVKNTDLLSNLVRRTSEGKYEFELANPSLKDCYTSDVFVI